MSAPEKRRLRVPGGELAFVEAGSPEDPALVLIHGFPTSSHMWRELVPICAPWMHVIAPDLLGMGDSGKTAPVTELGLRPQTEHIRGLLAALGIGEFAVVGHGVGGGIAQLLAVGEPERVRTMVLIDSAAFDAWPSETMVEARTQDMEAAPPDMPAIVRIAFDLGMHRGRLSQEDLSEYARPFSDPDGARSFARFIRAMDGEGLAGLEPDLERLECPTLIVWGEDDPFHPMRAGERLNEAMPSSSFAVLPGCGHFLTEEAPGTVLVMVKDYLRSRYLGMSHGHGGPGGPVLVQLERPSFDPSEWELEEED
jgi:pimeloyl-ACP methyl ester carboxylesterase